MANVTNYNQLTNVPNILKTTGTSLYNITTSNSTGTFITSGNYYTYEETSNWNTEMFKKTEQMLVDELFEELSKLEDKFKDS